MRSRPRVEFRQNKLQVRGSPSVTLRELSAVALAHPFAMEFVFPARSRRHSSTTDQRADAHRYSRSISPASLIALDAKNAMSSRQRFSLQTSSPVPRAEGGQQPPYKIALERLTDS